MSERSNNKKERDECLTIDTLNMEEFESYLFVPIHLLTQKRERIMTHFSESKPSSYRISMLE